MKHISILAALAAAAALAGCTTPGNLPPGTPIATVRQGVFGPNGEYALPNGGRRLEFARGSSGKETWMLDFDASGALVASEQVRTQANFDNIARGMPAEEVRMRLGRPSDVFGAGWHEHIHVWSYRFPQGDCFWFQVSIRDADQKVSEAGMGPDPVCNGPKGSERSP
jgi:hypothetical protein